VSTVTEHVDEKCIKLAHFAIKEVRVKKLSKFSRTKFKLFSSTSSNGQEF